MMKKAKVELYIERFWHVFQKLGSDWGFSETKSRENMWSKEDICWRGIFFLYVSCIFNVIAYC